MSHNFDNAVTAFNAIIDDMYKDINQVRALDALYNMAAGDAAKLETVFNLCAPLLRQNNKDIAANSRQNDLQRIAHLCVGEQPPSFTPMDGG